MKKHNGAGTIKDAVKGIKGGQYIIRAFQATRESDLFMGDLEKYLEIIAVRLEAQNELIKMNNQVVDSFNKHYKPSFSFLKTKE